MIHYSACPVCNSSTIQFVFTAKDYTVSKEDFPVWRCSNCFAEFTQDIPSQEEIGKYYQSENYISHSDTKKGFINSVYHFIRKTTLAGKRFLVKKETVLSQGNILDVGCGTGAFLHIMKQAGWKITGLEPDEQARQKAKSLYDLTVLSSNKIVDLQSHSYDAITAWHVMEHVHQLHEYFEKFKQLLAKNGRIFIAVPNYTSADAIAYKAQWAAFDVPRHLYHFSPESMRVVTEMHGLKVEKIKPMWFDSFYVSMLSEQYKNGKGNILKAFYNGLVSNLTAFINPEKCSSLIYIIKNTD